MTPAHRDDLNVLVMDVKKAHSNGKAQPEDGQRYMQAPPEVSNVGS